MNTPFFFKSLMLVGLFFSALFADRIHFTNGEWLDGKIVKKNFEGVQFKMSTATLFFSSQYIKEISQDAEIGNKTPKPVHEKTLKSLLQKKVKYQKLNPLDKPLLSHLKKMILVENSLLSPRVIIEVLADAKHYLLLKELMQQKADYLPPKLVMEILIEREDYSFLSWLIKEKDSCLPQNIVIEGLSQWKSFQALSLLEYFQMSESLSIRKASIKAITEVPSTLSIEILSMLACNKKDPSLQKHHKHDGHKHSSEEEEAIELREKEDEKIKEFAIISLRKIVKKQPKLPFGETLLALLKKQPLLTSQYAPLIDCLVFSEHPVTFLYLKELTQQKEMKQTAMMAIGKLGTPNAIDFLIQFQEKESLQIKKKIAFIFGKMKTIQAVPLLLGYLESNNRGLKRDAYWALKEISGQQYPAKLIYWDRWWNQKVMQQEQLNKWLDILLSSQQEKEILFALKKIEQLRDVEAVGEILMLLRDPSAQVKKAAHQTLIKLTGWKELPLDYKLWEMVFDAHPKNNQGNLSEWMDLLNEKKMEICQVAAKELATLNAKESVPELLIALQDQRTLVKNEVYKSLKKITKWELPPEQTIWIEWWEAQPQHHNGKRDQLLSFLEEEKNSSLYLAAIKELGRLKASEAIPSLIECLDNSPPKVRQIVCHSLKQITGWNQIPPYYKVWNRWWKAQPQNLQGEIEGLLSFIENPEDPLCNMAAQELGRLRKKEAIPLLIKALESEKPLLEQIIHRALIRITRKNIKKENWKVWYQLSKKG